MTGTGTATLTIDSIAAGGDGVGRAGGMAVFVPRAAPGDVAEVSYRLRGRFGRGDITRLVTPSPQRVAATCPHYDRDDCGGCQVQHLGYDAQLEAKRRIVQDAMRRIARRDVDVPAVVPSPEPWRYRSRLTLALRRGGNRWVIGLHSRRDVDRIFQLEQCPVTNDRVVAGWREVIAAAAYLPVAPELRGTVRLIGDSLAWMIEGGRDWPEARRFARACPSLAVIRWRSVDGALRTVSDRRSEAGPVESFDQVNRMVAELAREDLVAQAAAVAPRSAIDAYCGMGDTAVRLAARGVPVSVIESDPAATTVAAARLPGSSRVVTGRVEDHLASLLPADLVVLNPPRAGVDGRVTDVLETDRSVRAVIYMSCDPATLARDLSRLPSWRLEWLRAYDMFPQTAHVEVVCTLVREAA